MRVVIMAIYLLGIGSANAYTMKRGRIVPNSVTCEDVRAGVAAYGVEGLKAMGRAHGFNPTLRQIRAAQACMGQ